MTKKLIEEQCPMFNEPCPYCSIETTKKHPYTRLVKNRKTGLFDPDGKGGMHVELGARCNNGGGMIDEMHVCPRRWALHR